MTVTTDSLKKVEINKSSVSFTEEEKMKIVRKVDAIFRESFKQLKDYEVRK